MKNLTADKETISANLIVHLREELNDYGINFASDLTQIFGGYQTSTFHFQLDGVEGEMADRLVLRLYPPDYGTDNVIWESTLPNILLKAGLPVPKVHFVNADESVLGGAFVIMDYLPGEVLYTVSADELPRLLGQTHAMLHGIDPQPLIRKLNESGFDESRYGLTSQFDWLEDKAKTIPCIRESIKWLIKHRPTEPELPVVCHRDFHGLNILVDNDRVTGILDWGGLLITDPAFDVANTYTLHKIPAKYSDDDSSVDWDEMADQYLDTYRSLRPLNSANLEYYRVFRCLTILARGIAGLALQYQHPLVVRDLVAYIHKITGIRISVPAATTARGAVYD